MSEAALPLILLVLFALVFAALIPYARTPLNRGKPSPRTESHHREGEKREAQERGLEFPDAGASGFLRGVQLVSILLLTVLVIPWMAAVGGRQLSAASFGAAFLMAGLVLVGALYAEQTRRQLSGDEPPTDSNRIAASGRLAERPMTPPETPTTEGSET